MFVAFLDTHAARDLARPVVMVEDVHWADEATLDWLTFVGRRLFRIPALMIVTCRSDQTTLAACSTVVRTTVDPSAGV